MPAARALSFPILGRAFHAQDVSPALEAWLTEHWRFPADDAPPHPYAISLRETGAERARPATPAPQESNTVHATMPGFEVAWQVAGDRWWAELGGGGVELVLDPGEARITIWRPRGPAAPAQLRAALFLAIGEALRASGLLPLHGSVAVRDGRATAFIGPSGTGKSVTLLEAVRRGAHPLAEDFAWLDPGTLAVYGWDRGIRLWPAGRTAFAGHLEGAAWRTDPAGKLVLAYDELPVLHCPRATLARLALLTRDAACPSAWEVLPPRDAVRALWEATGVPLAAAARDHAAHQIPQLLRRLELRRLRLGSTPLPL